jgi:Domain of unknown function (DUF6265)
LSFVDRSLNAADSFSVYSHRQEIPMTTESPGFWRTPAAIVLMIGSIALASSGAQAPRHPTRASISRVAWLGGVWTGGAEDVSFEEQWMRPAAGSMLAVARTIKGDRMVAFEFLRIVERNDSLVYIAQPNGRPPTEFVLTEVTDESATFENPAHDFPKMIRYAKRPDGTLEATVSNGGQRAERFVFRRLP